MARSRKTFTGWGLAYRHNEGGQLWCLRHASFETVQGWMYISSPGIITFADLVTYYPAAGRLSWPLLGYGHGRFLLASGLTGIQRGINEETRVPFSDKQLLAYICRSDRAVAKRVDSRATLLSASENGIEIALRCVVGMDSFNIYGRRALSPTEHFDEVLSGQRKKNFMRLDCWD